MRSIHLDQDPKLDVLYTLPFGSQIYGSIHKYSDADVINIIKESTGDFVLRYWSGENNEDITYVGINEFLSGLSNCSNIEFFEALHTEQGRKFMEDHNLNLSLYYNSHQVKAFLGMAARDLKYPHRRKHCLRCIYIAEKIFNKELFIPKETPTQLVDLLSIYNFGTVEEIDSHIKELRENLVYE